MLKLVSFNINGVRARPHQIEVLRSTLDPDIIGLQESKVADSEFPLAWAQGLGYDAQVYGEKGHYGVALLSKQPPLAVSKGLPGDEEKAQRRLIVGRYRLAEENELIVLNAYCPQGESRNHPVKFPAKERFYRGLLEYLSTSFTSDQPIVLMGDMNIAPLDCDIGIGEDNAKRWLRTGKCAFLPEERAWFQALIDWGLIDAYRALHPEVNDRFSWFDYRSRGFERDPKRGLRIDHILISRSLHQHLQAADIDYEIRSLDKPSDHCPVWIALDLPGLSAS